jgi:hypothetical protein
MVSSGMLRRVILVRTGVSEERNATIIRVTRIDELVTTLTVFLRSVSRLLVTANVVPFTDSCHPDDGGDTFLRNVSSYKSHTV